MVVLLFFMIIKLYHYEKGKMNPFFSIKSCLSVASATATFFFNMKRVTAPKKYLPIESFEKEITELIFYVLEVYCFRTKHSLDTSDTVVKTIRELESLNR